MNVLDRPAPEPDGELRYAAHPDGVADLFLPEADADHLVVHLHGGFWRAAYDRTHARHVARALAEAGAVVVLPEYRRVGAGGGWPTTCQDVRLALDALPDLLTEAGIRTRSTTLSGHSAGGHLTLWLACTGTRADAFVPIAPVGDLRAAAEEHLGDDAVRDFLGVAFPIDDADPMILLEHHRPSAPITIVHGTADDTVPVTNSRGLVARHPSVALRELDGADHLDPVDPLSDAWPATTRELIGSVTD